MKIKKMYLSLHMPWRYVVETTDNQFWHFNCSPFREIGERDLAPLKYYNTAGRHGDEAPQYLYKLYGLEKCK